MSVKCPSCGFDSPDDAAWCDLCKEPFKKKAAVVAPVPAAPAAAPKPAAAPPEPTPEQAAAAKAKLEELMKQLSVEEKPVPAMPQWARLAAWCFLGLWVIFGFILMGVYMAKFEDARANAPVTSAAE